MVTGYVSYKIVSWLHRENILFISILNKTIVSSVLIKVVACFSVCLARSLLHLIYHAL